ncbi:methyl-accepting chemotaxis protein [Paenibacillus cremeus]|nr:methyl-accepting chemotaxis protein [Paenibacillus cremeus]
MRNKTRFGIIKKMVLGIAVVSTITYFTSAVFIFSLQDVFRPYLPQWLFIPLVLSLGIFWTTFLGWLAAKWLVKPLLQLTDAANQASSGHLNVEIIPSKSDDELHALGTSFHTMLENIRGMIAGISTNFVGTDTHVEELRLAIGQAASHIERITTTIDDIAQGAEQQSELSEAMFQSVEHITRATQDIHGQADTARQFTIMMIQVIEESTKVIQSLVSGVQKLADAHQETLHVVQQLEGNAKEIEVISGVVGELSNQTHLLALNASIEAARAGEHGKGFAVVAGEVKKLAEQSSHAVHDINQLLGQIQSEVRHAVVQMTDQFELASHESVKGESAAAALQSIIGEADKVSQAVAHIASMVATQTDQVQITLVKARDVADIAVGILSGARGALSSTQEQTAVMEEIAASSHVLREQSTNLKKQIGFFTV